MTQGGLPLYLVDAFTDRTFSGNPAAVCLVGENAEESWMQSVAAEMRHSETAFVTEDDGNGRGLRWFTPEAEVQLCGHATLASAHVLWETGLAAADEPIRFRTLSGVLTAVPVDAGIALDFPVSPLIPEPEPPGLAAALGSRPLAVFRTSFDLLVEIESPQAVVELAPDIAALAEIEARGVIVTAPGGRLDADFTSRFFAPRVGVDEDPVTGSSHCALGPFWSERLGRDVLVGHQASARGGRVTVSLADGRAELSGGAVTVVAGQILRPGERLHR